MWIIAPKSVQVVVEKNLECHITITFPSFQILAGKFKTKIEFDKNIKDKQIRTYLSTIKYTGD